MSEASVQEAPYPRVWSAARSACRLWTTLAFELKVSGRRNVPESGGVLVVSNHQSVLDPILLAVQLKRPTSFMAKSELFENRYFGGLIRTFNAFAVRRGEGDVGAIKEAIRRLKEGKVVVLFPEGTRSRRGEINPIQPGIAMLIRRAGVPVVPAVIDGSLDAWPRGKRLPQRHKIQLMYGAPLPLEGLKAGEVVERIGAAMNEMMGSLRARR